MSLPLFGFDPTRMDEAFLGRHTSDDGGKTMKCHAALQPSPPAAPQQDSCCGADSQGFCAAWVAAPGLGWQCGRACVRVVTASAAQAEGSASRGICIF